MTLYDPKCKELARHFLGHRTSDRLVQELAAEIQRLIERWIQNERNRILESVPGGEVH